MAKKETTPKVTRKLYLRIPADYWLALKKQAKLHGYLRTDVWQTFCTPKITAMTSVGKVRVTAQAFMVSHDRHGLQKKPAFSTIIDSINNIRAYHEAAIDKLLQDIRGSKFSDDDKETLRRIVYSGKFETNPWLHRHYRKIFRHGKNKTFNQIVLEDKNGYTLKNGIMGVSSLVPGKTIKLAIPDGAAIRGKIRLIVGARKGCISILWSEEQKEYRPCGTQERGIDKGFNEAFVADDGTFYGEGLGAMQRERADAITKKNKNRARLHALEKKHRIAGNFAKADKIARNNLGKAKQLGSMDRFKRQVKDLLYKEAHRLMDATGHLVMEDLKFVSKGITSRLWSHRLNKWVKGVMAEILEDVAAKRGCQVTMINAAYTSQMDSQSGLLQGRRSGEKFYHVSGEVSHAGINAAVNIKARLRDEEITLYTPYKAVKALLSKRVALVEEQGFNPGANAPVTSVNKRLNPDISCTEQLISV